MTKTCYSCKADKPLGDFGKSARNKDGLNYRCKLCYKNYISEAYSRNKEAHKAAVNTRRNKKLKVIHDWLGDYLSKHPCVDCGNADILVLEFDHVNDNKEGEVGRIVRVELNLEKVKAEVAKCEVRCVNCHRRITNKRRLEAKSNG